MGYHNTVREEKGMEEGDGIELRTHEKREGEKGGGGKKVIREKITKRLNEEFKFIPRHFLGNVRACLAFYHYLH